MNLNAYDSVEDKLDKTKTWADPKSKTIYSREFKYHKYYSLLKQYNTVTKTTDYFIAFMDNPPEFTSYKITHRDDFGRIKIKIYTLWDKCSLQHIIKKCNINIEHKEEKEDGDIYYLDI